MIQHYFGKLMQRKHAWMAAIALGASTLLSSSTVNGFEVLGVGTDALIGGDLTDPDDNGDPEADINYDAIFDANNEPGFGGGEFAFNVFDNLLGPSNDKWCCGVGGGIDEDNPLWVSAEFSAKYKLTDFTVSSANDVPDRDPIHWAIQGSNNGLDFTDIYVYEDDFGPWVERLEVIHFTAGDDFPVQTDEQAYQFFRFAAFDTIANPNGAYYQVGEIEFFGECVGDCDPLPRYVAGEDTIGQRLYEGEQTNEMYGPEMPGVSGWKVDLASDTGITIDNHTTAEDVLDEFIDDGNTSFGSYPVVDLGGGDGTFGDTQPYPNGVDDTSMSDFAVRAEAEVIIPEGTWTIGFGSDDGGQVTITDLSEFEQFSDNNDSFDDNQIRFEGNRGHGWTVGSFEVSGEPLETTIVASFHERGGGDSFEIAIIDDEFIEAANPDNGWELLADETFGWSVKHTGTELLSADLTVEVAPDPNDRPWEFDVNGDTGEADQFVVENPDPDVFTTVINIEGVGFQIKSAGTVASGDAFNIVDANMILGTPIITSVDDSQTWVFDPMTGNVCLDSCSVLAGDYNNDGAVDVLDIDLQSIEMKSATPDLAVFDENNDGVVDIADRQVWVETHKGTWMGDADLNGEFNSSDLVTVFTAGKYETEEMAGWADGDWNGDMAFGSGDLVTAFTDGGYEAGTRPSTAAVVPEPSSVALVLMGVLGVLGLGRRRQK